MRETALSGVIPPPLEDSPKCPRCSLVGICLPDETRLLAEPDRPLVKGDIRRLMPARDDALPLYVKEQGVTLGISGDVLTVKQRQEVLQKVKLLDCSQVCLLGNVQVTSQALRGITAAGIPVAHFSYGGWFYALTSGLVHKNVELRTAQFAAAADPKRSLRLARQFVVGKIKNSRTLLRRHLTGDDRQPIRQLAELARKAKAARDAASLLGIEGMAAKEYFAGFARLLKEDSPFSIEGRNRRPPRDPVNALLSFVYAMLVKELTIVLHTVGFDPMLGFFHRPRYGRPSLALDLAEEFRPLVGDSVVLTLINNGEVTPSSFVRRAGAVALTDAGRGASSRRSWADWAGCSWAGWSPRASASRSTTTPGPRASKSTCRSSPSRFGYWPGWSSSRSSSPSWPASIRPSAPPASIPSGRYGRSNRERVLSPEMAFAHQVRLSRSLSPSVGTPE